jgi:hypothetical protein
MENLVRLILVVLIIIFWITANAFNKPILNRMHNYYEDDKEGRDTANFFIGLMLILAFILGYRAA